MYKWQNDTAIICLFVVEHWVCLQLDGVFLNGKKGKKVMERKNENIYKAYNLQVTGLIIWSLLPLVGQQRNSN